MHTNDGLRGQNDLLWAMSVYISTSDSLVKLNKSDKIVKYNARGTTMCKFPVVTYNT